VNEIIALNRVQTEAALEPLELLAAVRGALISISSGEVSAPPRIAAFAPNGALGAMPAYVAGAGLAAKLISIFAGAHAGRSVHAGLVTLFDQDDGRPLAIIEAGALTAARTAAAATLSMSVIGDRPICRVAVVGTGVQARAQVDLLAALYANVDLVVGGRSLSAATGLAARHPLGSADSIEGAVRGADVVFCCTGAREPVISRAWLAPGTHVSSVGGSDGPELDSATIADGELYVEWAGACLDPPPAGAHELQGVPVERIQLLGTVLNDECEAAVLGPDRDPDRLTVFKSTGHAALDVAAAAAVYQYACRHDIGTLVPM